jgi:uncharacterized repeat protein (TIGR01451 family)
MKPEQWTMRSGVVCLMLAVVCGALVEHGGLQVPGSASTLSVRVAQAAPSASGSWTQSEWLTPTTTLAAVASGTSQYFRPSSVSSYGQLVGTFGVCAGTGAWCQGPGDSAPGQTLRLAGNHKSDAGNLYSSDLNGDGISELLFANYYNGSTTVFNGGWIYWGQGAPTSPSWSTSQRTDLPTNGTWGMAVYDLNGDGFPEVLFSSYSAGDYIYWGQSGGTYGVWYSAIHRSELPVIGSTYGLAVADLNRDGRPEVINGSRIYWGQAGGAYGLRYSAAAHTTLSLGMVIAVADLNSDGWPELVVNGNGNFRIYWGQAGGVYGVDYSNSASTVLPTPSQENYAIAVADLNSDGLPEVIQANCCGPGVNFDSYIYWAQAGGTYGVSYTTSNRTALPMTAAYNLSVVDLNGDGQRDVVVQNCCASPQFVRVFWGPFPASGTATNSWTFSHGYPGIFYGMSLSDLNSDGRVDLLISRYASDGAGGRVYFHNGNHSAPYSVVPSSTLRVDFATAYVSFGPGRGTTTSLFGQPRATYGAGLPAYGVLESMVIDSGKAGTVWQSVSTTAALTVGTGISLFVAASDTLSAVSNPSWIAVGAIGDGSQSQALSGVNGRYARYRVVLWRDSTTEASPALEEITFNYLARPAAFSKAAPLSGETGQPTNPTLSWSATSGADHYRYCNNTASGCVPGISVGVATSVTLSGLTPGTTYYWQVRACADAGCTVFSDANGGAHWSYTVVMTPSAFSKLTPADGSAGQPANLMLSWGTASGVHHYRYCYSTTPGCVPVTDVGTATSAALGGLTPATTYYWQVRACADSGCTVFADANGGHWSLTVTSAPGTFNKTEPADGVTGQPANLTLSWDAASGAIHYRYCVATAPGCTPTTSIGTATSVALSGLTPATTYYWQVRACADSGCTVFSDADGGYWSFAVAAAPGAFGKLSPADGATNQPTSPMLSWSAASGATHYRYCVATVPGCAPATSAGMATQVVLSGLTAGATYYWQVRACADAGCTVFSDADAGMGWSFKVMTAPGAFSKLSPANGATDQPMSPVLSWGAASGANHYRYCVATAPGCTPTTSAGTGTSVALSGLTSGMTYYWQVRACGDAWCTSYVDAHGGHWSFRVMDAPTGFNKIAPANGAVGQPVSLMLVWGAMSGAHHYRYCYSTTPGCVPTTSVGTATSVALHGLTPGRTYYWQVRACAHAPCSAFTEAGSSHWSFTVARLIEGLDHVGTRKGVSPTLTRVGELVTYTVVLSNSGSTAVTVQMTDTLAVSATLVSATPGYSQAGQTLVWSNVVVPAGGTTTLTVTVRAASGPLPGGYTLDNSVQIGTADGQIVRNAPSVAVMPWQAFVPVVRRP